MELAYGEAQLFGDYVVYTMDGNFTFQGMGDWRTCSYFCTMSFTLAIHLSNALMVPFMANNDLKRGLEAYIWVRRGI